MRLSNRFKDVLDALFGADAEPLQAPGVHQFRRKVHKIDSWEADFRTMTLSVVKGDGLLLSAEPILFDLHDEGGELYMRFEREGRVVAIENIENRLASDERDTYNDERDRYELARLKADKPMRLPEGIDADLQAAYRRYLASRTT
jgi:hypothetical protein